MTENINNQSNWVGLEELTKSLNPLKKEYSNELEEILKRSQSNLDKKKLTEPADTDWSTFRPLNRDNENNWSDWLAHILETAPTGYFAKELFNDHEILEDYKNPEVQRETGIQRYENDQSGKDYRTDILIHWKNKSKHIHIEVKKYDSNFEKTFPTSKSVNEFLNHNAKHFILIPEENKSRCIKEFEKLKQEPEYSEITINIITWDQVAHSLRKTILNEEITDLNKKYNEWNVWACSFLGCIEQKLLWLNKKDSSINAISALIIYHKKILGNNNMTNLSAAEKENKFLQKGLDKYMEFQNSFKTFEYRIQNHIQQIIKNIFIAKKEEIQIVNEKNGWDASNFGAELKYFYEDLVLILNKSEEKNFQYGFGWYKSNAGDNYTFMIYVMFFGEYYKEELSLTNLSKPELNIFVEHFPGAPKNSEYCLIKKFKIEDEDKLLDFKTEFEKLITELIKI